MSDFDQRVSDNGFVTSVEIRPVKYVRIVKAALTVVIHFFLKNMLKRYIGYDL